MKFFVKLIIFLFLIAGVVLAFLPKIASTTWGAPYIIRLVDGGIPGTVSVEKLTLSWKGPQSAEGVRWRSDQVEVNAPKITSSATLFALLVQRNFAITKATNPQLLLSDATLKTVPITQANLLPSFRLGHWTGMIEVQNGLIQYLEDTVSAIDAQVEKTKELISIEWQAVLQEQTEGKALISLKDKAFSTQGRVPDTSSVWEAGGKYHNRSITEWRSGGKHLSTSLLEVALRILLKEHFPLTGILGKQTDFVFNYEQNGPVEGYFMTPNLVGKFRGKMDGGVLHLETPFETTLILTEQLNQTFRDNPLGVSDLHGNKPIKLQIASNESAIPLDPWNPSRLELSRGRLDLSIITCHLPGELGTLFKFLHQEKLRVVPIQLWFSPLDFSAKDGAITIERTDFLMDKTFHLCFWGEYNLLKHRLSLTLGVTKPTLERIFKITGLPEGYVLQIPVSMRDGEFKMNLKKAAEKVGKIILWYKSCEQGLPALPLPDEKHPAPPPKLPHPWDLVL